MPSSGGQKCALDRKSTRLNSSHTIISYAVFCLKKKIKIEIPCTIPFTHSTQARTRHSSGTSRACRRGQGLLGHANYSHDPAEALFFFFKDTATPEIYPLSLPVALPI